MAHYNYNEVAIIDIVTLCNVRSQAQATQWLIDNLKYQVTMNPYPTATLAAYNISVLTNFGQLDWLKEASDFIDYKKTYPYLEELYLLHSNSQLIPLIEKEISDGKVIDKTLADVLTGFGIGGYYAHNYEKYMSFEFNFTTKGIVYTLLENNHDLVNYCYSFPFFRSMIDNNKITDLTKCNLSFVTISLSDGDTVMFKLDYDKGEVVKYFDYSNNPPLRTMGSFFTAVTEELAPMFEGHKIIF